MAITLDGTNGIGTPDLESTGPITGTTGTFSGNVTANGLSTELRPLVLGTSQASTSGTTVDFTGIPSWVKRITVMFSGVSTSGTSPVQIQLGDSGGFETTGYNSGAMSYDSGTPASSTTGLLVDEDVGGAAALRRGQYVISNLSGNLWVGSGVMIVPNLTTAAGDKTLSDTLTQLRITTVNGTDTFDAGTINIMYE